MLISADKILQNPTNTDNVNIEQRTSEMGDFCPMHGSIMKL